MSRAFFVFFGVAKLIGFVIHFYFFQTTSLPSLAPLKIVDTSWISPQRGSFPWAEKDCRRMNGFASDARWRRNTSWEPTLRSTTSLTLMLSANTSGDFRILSTRKGLILSQRKDSVVRSINLIRASLTSVAPFKAFFASHSRSPLVGVSLWTRALTN